MSQDIPYFVMEYVEGQRIGDYSREKQLSVPLRLELFRKVCAAVGYAHQHLVIHRDLKPANIRVTPEGEPKLLDFGIAKLLDPQTVAMTEQTITRQAVMTPDYASPEQVRGESMTTASDVSCRINYCAIRRANSAISGSGKESRPSDNPTRNSATNNLIQIYEKQGIHAAAQNVNSP